MFCEDFCARFAGVARLYGAGAFERIVRSRVCLIGLGGVGSWAEKGDPASGIAPGTKWEDVPADWLCPDCGVGKDAFKPA